MMRNIKLILGICFMLFVTTAEACRYTIREIGFSTLNKVNYVIYRVDENTQGFSKQLEQSFSNSNVKTFALGANSDTDSSIVTFAKQQNLSFPAYVLKDKSGRMLALSEANYKNNLKAGVLSSPVQQHLLKHLPESYGSVLLIEGSNAEENAMAKETILKTCQRITNIMPNMTKQVDIGPDLVTIGHNQLDDEKVLLWSLGIEGKPKEPMAFILYGKGRIMGEQINFESIKKGDVHKLLSIIGADCECGLDRKWMLGYQVPLDWPNKTRQELSDRLGFDVDNPMVLTEMSRILAIENRKPVDPDGVTYEPVVVDLDDEFDDIPEVEHNEQANETEANEEGSSNVIWYSLITLSFLICVGAVFVLKKSKSK